MDRPESLVRERGQGLGQPGNAAEVADWSAPRRPYVLDRGREQALEAFLDELRDLRVHQLARDREVALDREAADSDRRTPQPVGIARTGRPLPEPERDVERVDLVRRGEHAAGLRGR